MQMYSMLIVDDEQVERDGIKYLISKFNLSIEVIEAGNGKKALELMKLKHIDILFTDIKMPFMDGLDLSHYARNINPNIKIIIFSAFGEFDYAKKAIENNVQKYILKPIDPDEFFNVMTQTIKNCSDDEEEAVRVEKFTEVYNKGIVYEKEKLIIDLLNGAIRDEKYVQSLREMNVDLLNESLVILFIDFKERFFELKNDEFIDFLKNKIQLEFEYLNFNEYQSVVLFKNIDKERDKHVLEEVGQKILQSITLNQNHKACLIFSNTVRQIKHFHEEYKKIEQMLDYSFFFNESVVLFSDGGFPHISVSTDIIDNIIDDIYATLESADVDYMRKSIDCLFNTLKENVSLSPIYVKYICADIAKKAVKKFSRMDGNLFKSSLEKIFLENNMANLKEDMLGLISVLTSNSRINTDFASKKVIKNVLEIIDNEYMKDIGLEYIANKVYLNPTYLSYLFKRETGQNIIKYIISFRMKKARELLHDTNLKISDICEKVGYNKISYFCSIFKNHFGMTPAKYRENGG